MSICRSSIPQTYTVIYVTLIEVTHLDLVIILQCMYLTAWTIVGASWSRIARSTYAAARSRYPIQELFTQGFFSVCVLLH
jgi:hypothetical protein